MGAVIPSKILGVTGQCVKSIRLGDSGEVMVYCERDRRRKPRLEGGQRVATCNRRLRRTVQDLPVWGRKVWLDTEYQQLRTVAGRRVVESFSFVEPGMRFTKRFARFISQLCRHMPIDAVARYSGLAWRTVKKMDQCCLSAELPDLDPTQIGPVRYLGVDEVARAKGQDYVTVIYDLDRGHLLGVVVGRKKAGLVGFLNQLPSATREAIEAVAMDMWEPFALAVKECLPGASIVYDRFHVMQNYSKVIDQVRRAEFKAAGQRQKALIRGSRYLLLKNKPRLSDKQHQRLLDLLIANENLHVVYLLKEQLQALWDDNHSVEQMREALEGWCELADASAITQLRGFARLLRRHQEGICQWAKHPISTARVEAGNVAIGMIRKRARGLLDIKYFKLKIRQSAIPEEALGLYALR